MAFLTEEAYQHHRDHLAEECPAFRPLNRPPSPTTVAAAIHSGGGGSREDYERSTTSSSSHRRVEDEAARSNSRLRAQLADQDLRLPAEPDLPPDDDEDDSSSPSPPPPRSKIKAVSAVPINRLTTTADANDFLDSLQGELEEKNLWHQPPTEQTSHPDRVSQDLQHNKQPQSPPATFNLKLPAPVPSVRPPPSATVTSGAYRSSSPSVRNSPRSPLPIDNSRMAPLQMGFCGEVSAGGLPLPRERRVDSASPSSMAIQPAGIPQPVPHPSQSDIAAQTQQMSSDSVVPKTPLLKPTAIEKLKRAASKRRKSCESTESDRAIIEKLSSRIVSSNIGVEDVEQEVMGRIEEILRQQEKDRAQSREPPLCTGTQSEKTQSNQGRVTQPPKSATNITGLTAMPASQPTTKDAPAASKPNAPAPAAPQPKTTVVPAVPQTTTTTQSLTPQTATGSLMDRLSMSMPAPDMRPLNTEPTEAELQVPKNPTALPGPLKKPQAAAAPVRPRDPRLSRSSSLDDSATRSPLSIPTRPPQQQLTPPVTSRPSLTIPSISLPSPSNTSSPSGVTPGADGQAPSWYKIRKKVDKPTPEPTASSSSSSAAIPATTTAATTSSASHQNPTNTSTSSEPTVPNQPQSARSKVISSWTRSRVNTDSFGAALEMADKPPGVKRKPVVRKRRRESSGEDERSGPSTSKQKLDEDQSGRKDEEKSAKHKDDRDKNKDSKHKAKDTKRKDKDNKHMDKDSKSKGKDSNHMDKDSKHKHKKEEKDGKSKEKRLKDNKDKTDESKSAKPSSETTKREEDGRKDKHACEQKEKSVEQKEDNAVRCQSDAAADLAKPVSEETTSTDLAVHKETEKKSLESDKDKVDQQQLEQFEDSPPSEKIVEEESKDDAPSESAKESEESPPLKVASLSHHLNEDAAFDSGASMNEGGGVSEDDESEASEPESRDNEVPASKEKEKPNMSLSKALGEDEETLMETEQEQDQMEVGQTKEAAAKPTDIAATGVEENKKTTSDNGDTAGENEQPQTDIADTWGRRWSLQSAGDIRKDGDSDSTSVDLSKSTESLHSDTEDIQTTNDVQETAEIETTNDVQETSDNHEERDDERADRQSINAETSQSDTETKNESNKHARVNGQKMHTETEDSSSQSEHDEDDGEGDSRGDKDGDVDGSDSGSVDFRTPLEGGKCSVDAAIALDGEGKIYDEDPDFILVQGKDSMDYCPGCDVWLDPIAGNVVVNVISKEIRLVCVGCEKLVMIKVQRSQNLRI